MKSNNERKSARTKTTKQSGVAVLYFTFFPLNHQRPPTLLPNLYIHTTYKSLIHLKSTPHIIRSSPPIPSSLTPPRPHPPSPAHTRCSCPTLPCPFPRHRPRSDRRRQQLLGALLVQQPRDQVGVGAAAPEGGGVPGMAPDGGGEHLAPPERVGRSVGWLVG
jgi:hypothetical protein